MPKLVESPPAARFTPAPHVTLVNAFARPFDNAVATARTCYSPRGIVTAEQVGGAEGISDEERGALREKRDRLARSIFKAGHHTTLQHAHFQFALENVSRQFLWGFLHSHPFYNSEQVSQRYVTVDPSQVARPPLSGEAACAYDETVAAQTEAYRDLTERLRPLVDAEYRKRFPHADRMGKRAQAAVQKKAQEVARYVLPVATLAYLYHTVSALTLMRYWRMCQAPDVPLEQRLVVEAMVGALLAADPDFRTLLQEPMPLEDTTEARLASKFAAASPSRKAFREEFDAELGGLTSKLVDWSPNAPAVLASSVRAVFGLPSSTLPDDEAVAWAVDPARNRTFGETMNVTTHSKLSRALFHVHYVFKKRLSHTADSQDQRHRMTPGSRPLAAALALDEPDYVTPALVRMDPAVEQIYTRAMERSWEGIRKLQRLGVTDEFASYLLPNAVCVRFTESADLLNLHHKHAMRLCYNAQEEIWQASLDEARQIRRVHPSIGKWLLPPCGLRERSVSKPICPEGDRFCGVVVWKLDLHEYQRVI